ncbi:hypothetical protein Acor_33880 [Acrocarpospora corrugata]|uniref:PI-PLC Y-box domain-containing protein n=1 Tax=Acrocarpospora corrugata TaxID=35763 RepID=A0A5M3VXY0_9ACTN|nr:RCC1 domain-containing protein [Acrocarpospora corrugata]GES01324.1 hypothetical protein Acor_33880 [Acrocarpospora corrugata]
MRFATVSGSNRGAAAIGTDGKVYAWGFNSQGQLGDGTDENRTTPVAVDFDAVSAAVPTATTLTLPDGLERDVPYTATLTVTPATATGQVRLVNLTTGSSSSLATLVDGTAQVTATVAADGPQEIMAEFVPTLSADFKASASVPVTALFGPGPRPLIKASRSQIITTLDTAENADLTLTLTDGDTPVEDVAVTVSSSNPLITPAQVTVTGTGATRTVRISPALTQKIDGVVLTFTAKDLDGNTSTVDVSYFASLPTPSSTATYYYGDADASAAVDAGDDYVLVADDEHQTVKLYQSGQSGYPDKEFDGGTNLEIDLESAARVGNLIYWLGSHGNNRSGESRPSRKTLFTTTVRGSGASTEIAGSRAYTSLWNELLAWDSSNGHGLGANRLMFVAASGRNVQPNPPNGFNIEGFSFAPGSASIGYLGFRAPSITVEGTERALIVPVNNFDALVAGTAAQPEFGAPILPNLGGRTIRDIRRNANNEYLIVAGPGVGVDTGALYTWNGEPATAPVLNQILPTIDFHVGGAWEAISVMPDRLVTGAKVELISDTGDAALYGPGEAKDLARPFRKAYTDTFTLADTFAPETAATIAPAQPASGWFTGAALVTLSADDEAQGSGIGRTEYRLDGGAWTGYSEPVVIAGDGSHTLAYRSVDKAGNVEVAKTLAVKADAIAPVTTAGTAPANDAGWHGDSVPVVLSATDQLSGMAVQAGPG